MPARRANPYGVKQHRTYTAGELATCLGVHKNTVRNWQREGLEPVEARRPLLFHGETVRAFLLKRGAARKRPCPPGTLYCLRCRQPRAPHPGTVEFVPMEPRGGSLRAVCGCCGLTMHRRTRETDVARQMPGCEVQYPRGHPSLIGTGDPSLNCDLERNE